MPRIDSKQLDLAKSMDFDKEQFLDDLVASINTTREEFERLYILEEFPMDITIMDYYDVPHDLNRMLVSTKQVFQIRRKTQEEMAEDISRHITQGEN